MSFVNVLCYALLICSLSGCKSGPTAEDSSSVSTQNGFDGISANAELNLSADESTTQELIVSSASTEVPIPNSVSNYPIKAGEFNHHPKETSAWDESGWSILTPAADSRLIYVSSSLGDDITAEFYAPRDVKDIQDPGLIKPYKDIHAAMKHVREGYPDWVLLHRGDSWNVEVDIELKAGRGLFERSVLTSYGESSIRPMIKSTAARTIIMSGGTNYVAVMGLSLYANERDPHSLDFQGWGSASKSAGITIFSPDDKNGGSILLEDNDLNYFNSGILLLGSGKLVDIEIRRNIIRNSYSEDSHSQGIYANTASVYLEENIFDHNGWFKQQIGSGNDKAQGQATFFNHNTYFSDAFNTRFINNFFLRSSSIQNKWTANSDSISKVDSVKSFDLLIEGNLYVGGEVGISAGGNTDYDNGPRWNDIRIIDNVLISIGRDQPTNRALGWGVEATDWDGGVICGNYLLDTDNINVTNVFGIKVSGHSDNVNVTRNTIAGIIAKEPDLWNAAISINLDIEGAVVVSENSLQLSESKLRLVNSDDRLTIEFNSNRYLSGLDDQYWFRLAGENQSFDGWTNKKGDSSSTVGKDHFVEPKRTFESYLASIGETSDINSFVQERVKYSRRSSGETVTAAQVIQYLREGYGDKTCAL